MISSRGTASPVAQEALGDVRAQVAATAERLDRAVGADPRALGDEQLGHRRLAVHELRVAGRVVGERTHGQRQGPRRRDVGGRVGERERDALVVVDPRAALLARRRPRDRLLEQPPHRAEPARRDAEALLGEPRALEIVADADPADHGIRGDLDAGEADGRMAVRVVVRERRVVDDLDARRLARYEEERRAPAVGDHVRHDDVDARDVARRHEPLLAVDHEAGVGRHGDGGDP
jgi:hypothetical protein